MCLDPLPHDILPFFCGNIAVSLSGIVRLLYYLRLVLMFHLRPTHVTPMRRLILSTSMRGWPVEPPHPYISRQWHTCLFWRLTYIPPVAYMPLLAANLIYIPPVAWRQTLFIFRQWHGGKPYLYPASGMAANLILFLIYDLVPDTWIIRVHCECPHLRFPPVTKLVNASSNPFCPLLCFLRTHPYPLLCFRSHHPCHCCCPLGLHYLLSHLKGHTVVVSGEF